MVVWPQRGGLLPHRGLPRNHVLLHPQARQSAGLFLPAVDHSLLGADLPLHLGGPASSALHRAARLGADARHDLLDHAVDAVMGRHDQRHHDAVRRLGQAAHRSRAAHAGRVGRLLRHVDLRRSADGDQGSSTRCRTTPTGPSATCIPALWAGSPYLLRRALLPGALAVQSAAVLAQAGELALLDLDHRHRALHHLDVGVGHPARPDVARLHRHRLPRIFLRRVRRGHAPLLRHPRAWRRAVPDRRADHGLQLLQTVLRPATGESADVALAPAE